MDTGSIAFILICAALVLLMTPALAFFYGGLEGVKCIEYNDDVIGSNGSGFHFMGNYWLFIFFFWK